MRSLLIAILLLCVAGCGGGVPRIATPADGQTFILGQFQYFDVTLESNDYTDVAITLSGDVPTGEVYCAQVPGGVMRCQPQYSQNGQMGGNYQMCQPSCTAIIIAAKGDQRDFRVVKFTRGTGAPTTPTAPR